jgi:hypothetical protein
MEYQLTDLKQAPFIAMNGAQVLHVEGLQAEAESCF